MANDNYDYSALDALFGYEPENLPPLDYGVPEYDVETPQQGQPTLAPSGGASENAQYAYNYFLSKGLSPVHAAALVGNFMQESGMRPEVVNSIGATGIAQHLGSRKQQLLQRANPKSLQTQLDFIWDELNGTEKNAFNKLLQTNNLQDATYAVRKHFERPGEAEANDPRRLREAQKLLGLGPVDQLSPAPSQAQPQQVTLSDGNTVMVEPGMSMDEVAAQLQQAGFTAKPMRPFALPDGNHVMAEYDMPDEEVTAMLQQQQPSLLQPQGSPNAAQDNTGYLDAAKQSLVGTAGSITKGLGTELGELGKAAQGMEWLGGAAPSVSQAVQGWGKGLHEKGAEWEKSSEGMFHMPEDASWMEKNIGYPIAGALGSSVPFFGALAVPGAGVAGTAARVAAEYGLGHGLGMGEAETAAEEVNKPFVPSEARPTAAGIGAANTVGVYAALAPLKALLGRDAVLGAQGAVREAIKTGGIDAARQMVGSRVADILKQVGIAEVGEIGSEVTEDMLLRAYQGKSLTDDEALGQYLDSAKYVAPSAGLFGGVGGYGHHRAKQQEVARAEEALAQAEAAQAQARQAQEIHGEQNLADVEKIDARQQARADIPPELEGVPEPIARAYMDMEANPLPQPTQVSGEAAPEQPESNGVFGSTQKAKTKTEEVPPPIDEPKLRPTKSEQPVTPTPIQPVPYYDELGLNKRTFAYKALRELNPENPEHTPLIREALNEAEKLKSFDANKIQALRQRLDQIAPPEPTTPPKPTKVEPAPSVNLSPTTQTPGDLLGISPNQALYKRLQKFDVNNVEDHPKIQEEILKTVKEYPGLYPAGKLKEFDQALTQIRETSNAQQNAQTETVHAGSSPLPTIRQEGRGASISGAGVHSSGQKSGQTKIKKAETETVTVNPEFTKKLKEEFSNELNDLQNNFGLSDKEIDALVAEGAKHPTYEKAHEVVGNLLDSAYDQAIGELIDPTYNQRNKQQNKENKHPDGSITIKESKNEIEGAKYPTTDNTGKALHPTESGIRAFWRHFAGTKVVDDEGRPLRVYHGTPNGGFSSFDPDKLGKRGMYESARAGFYFSKNAQYASLMANDVEAPHPTVYPAYLSIKNPLHVFTTELKKASEVDKMIAEAKKGGHDGIIDEMGNFVVFDPSQIKSAIGNKGDFDTSKSDIREAHINNPDAGVRLIDTKDYSDITNARQLVQRYKEKGTDPELLKLIDTISASPHLESVPVKWVGEGDKPHPDVVRSFNEGAAATAAWDAEGKPTLYFRNDVTDDREDVLVHEAVHAVTEAAIARNPHIAKELKDLSRQIGYSLSEAAGFTHDKKRDQLRDFWSHAVKDNPGELIAYGLTSPSYREVLSKYAADGKPLTAYRSEGELNALRKNPVRPAKNFRVPAPKPLTLWDKFVDAVAKLFGLPTKRKEAFKQQLNDYLNKKAEYEKHVEDYNTLRPFQEKLDTIFKELLRETSKKGVELSEAATREVKSNISEKPLEAPKNPTKQEVKEAARRLDERGLVGKIEDRSVGRYFRELARDLFKEGRNSSFHSEYIDARSAIGKKLAALQTMVNGKARGDFIYSAHEQRGNAIQEGYRQGYNVIGADGTLSTVYNKQYSPVEIYKRVGAANKKIFNQILVAMRVKTIREHDRQKFNRANDLMDKAERMQEYADSLTDPARSRKFRVAAESLKKIAHKHLKQIHYEKGRTIFTDEDVRDAETLLNAHPELAREAENVYELLRKQIDMWESEGLISHDYANTLREYPNYFPLYKNDEFEKQIADPMAHIRDVISHMGRGVKTITTIKAQRNHAHAVFAEENLLRHLAYMASVASEHSARRTTAKNLEVLGGAERILKGKGGPDDLVVLFKENGRDTYYKIHDPAVYMAMQSSASIMSPMLKRLRNFTHFARNMMVMNPAFWVRQVFREPVQASMVGGVGLITPLDTLSSMAKIMAGKSTGFKRLQAKGVVGPVDVIPDAERFIEKMVKGKGAGGKFLDGVKKIHEIVDASTRVVVYDRALQEAKKMGMDNDTADAYAVIKSREIINFAKQGRNETIRAIRAVTPFFGATLNSLDVLARAAMPSKLGNLSKAEAMAARRNFYTNAAMLSLFTMGYVAAMSRDDDYLRNSDKRGNFIIPWSPKDSDVVGIKIPVAFEVGWFTKELPEIMMLYNMGGLTSGQALAEAGKSFNQLIAPPMPMIYALQPLVEAVMNYDFHTMSPIESGRDEGTLTSLRNRKAGELTKAIVEKMEEKGVQVPNLSPDRLEHVLKKYLGQYWGLIRAASDAVLEDTGGVTAPAKELSEMPLLGTLLSKGSKDVASDQFYSALGEIKEVQRAMSNAKVTGDPREILKLRDPEHFEKYVTGEVMKPVEEQITAISTMIERIARTPNITDPKEKARIIRELKARRNVWYQRGVDIAKNAGMY